MDIGVLSHRGLARIYIIAVRSLIFARSSSGDENSTISTPHMRTPMS